MRLREKQKLKRFYGVLEKQFRRYFALASRSTENTGEVLLSIMERRLDNVVHRLGFAPSRAAARQLVGHGHILLNGKKANIPSLLLKVNDIVTVKNRPRGLQLVKLNLQESPPPVPDYLERVLDCVDGFTDRSVESQGFCQHSEDGSESESSTNPPDTH